jgi:hypothetical protein
MKVLGFILLILIALGGSPAMAQNYSPKKQCKMLIKKKRFGTKRPKPRYRVAKNNNKLEGAERESSYVASPPPKKSRSPKSQQTVAAFPVKPAKEKKRKQEKPVEQVALVKKGAIIFNGQSNAGDKEAIEAEVNQKIAEIKEGESIVLDPVYLKDNNGQLEIVNMKPFLMAVEFGKKGRHVEVNGNMGTPEETTARIERFKQMLVSMGVSPDLVSTAKDPRVMASATDRHVDFIVH